MDRSTLFVLLGILVFIVVIVGLAIIGRLILRRRRVAQLQQRPDDQVHYAFVINPSKPSAAQVREQIEQYCTQKQLTQISFIDTQLDKDGRACAREALANGADVVIAVGGDGTVRTVASALAGTNHAMGIIPNGTGNLFARNMGIPVDDVEAALSIALSHGSHRVDVGRLHILDREEDHGHAFLIIAGVGFDADMIDDTDPNLKRTLSWVAYFISGARHLFSPKLRASVTITTQDGAPLTNNDLEFRTFMAGNCGQIPVFSLMPDAAFNDGLLDFEVIDTTGGLLGWVNLFGDVVHQTITGRSQQSPFSVASRIEQMQGVSAEVRLQQPVRPQVDGDMLPETQHIRFSVERESLIVRVPLPEETQQHNEVAQ